MPIKQMIRSAASIVILGGAPGGCIDEEEGRQDLGPNDRADCIPDSSGFLGVGVELLAIPIDAYTAGYGSVALDYLYESGTCGEEDMAAAIVEQVQEAVGTLLDESNARVMYSSVKAAADYIRYYDRNSCEEDHPDCSESDLWMSKRATIAERIADLRTAWNFFGAKDNHLVLPQSLVVAALISAMRREDEALMELLGINQTWESYGAEMCDMGNALDRGLEKWEQELAKFSNEDIEEYDWSNGFMDNAENWHGIQKLHKEGNEAGGVPDGVIYCFKYPMDGKIEVECTDNNFNDTAEAEALSKLKESLNEKKSKFRDLLGDEDEFDDGMEHVHKGCIGLHSF